MIAIAARDECEAVDSAENAVAAVLALGSRLTLAMPDGGVLEITLDRIDEPHVALGSAIRLLDDGPPLPTARKSARSAKDTTC